MKLATYKDGSRDGQLVVVSRDLTTAHYATGIASRLQQALDDWNFIAPQLQDLYDALNAGRARHPFPFDAAQCMAPLPRAYQRLAARDWMSELAMVSCMISDPLLGARSPIPASVMSSSAGLAVITGDAPPGATPEQGQDAIRLMTLIHALDLGNDVQTVQTSLNLRGAAALGPTAVTPDELGAAWRDARVHLNLSLKVNGQPTRSIEAGDMRWSFGEFIAVATRKTLPLAAGAIVGSAPGKSDVDPDLEYVGDIPRKNPPGDWLRAGDVVRIEMLGPDGQSVFGAIEQTVE